MSTERSTFQASERTAAGLLHDHWVMFLVEGVVLLVLGATAIVLPVLATLAVTILFGWLFLLSGVVGLVGTLWMRTAPGFWWSLLSALLGIVVGVLLIWAPVSAMLSLTFVLIAFFVIEGVVSIMFALDHKREMTGQWGWIMLSGIIDIVLGAMLFAGLPGTAAWAIGLLVGINMVFGGAAMIALAMGARRATG